MREILPFCAASLANVVITISSPALQGEQIVATDGNCGYRVPNLPAGGGYAVRVETES